MDLGMPRKIMKNSCQSVRKSFLKSVILRLHDDNLGNTSIWILQSKFNLVMSGVVNTLISFLDGYPEDGIHYWLRWK